MTIETKFNIGDMAYFMDNGKPCKYTITGIETITGESWNRQTGELRASLLKGRTSILYNFRGAGINKSEKDVFSTLAELKANELRLLESSFNVIEV